LEARHPSTIVIPLTTNLVEDAEPLRIRIPAQGLLEKASDLLIDQAQAIDNQRLIKGPLREIPMENQETAGLELFIQPQDKRGQNRYAVNKPKA